MDNEKAGRVFCIEKLQNSKSHAALYPLEQLKGGHYCYEDQVATATNNVHLIDMRRRLARPRNGDLDF